MKIWKDIKISQTHKSKSKTQTQTKRKKEEEKGHSIKQRSKLTNVERSTGNELFVHQTKKEERLRKNVTHLTTEMICVQNIDGYLHT